MTNQTEQTAYSSPTGHDFKDREFATCFELLVQYIKNLCPEFDSGAKDIEYIVFRELEKTKHEQGPHLTDAELCLLISLRDKIGGWVSFEFKDKPLYVSLPYWQKQYEKWRKQYGALA